MKSKRFVEPEPEKFEVKAVQYISVRFPEGAKRYRVPDFATGDSLTPEQARELAEALKAAAHEIDGDCGC